MARLTKGKDRVKRKHHFVSVMHLAGFTHTGTKDGTLQVFDLKTGESREAIPESVAYQRDLNRITLPGISPDAVESAIGDKIEAPAAAVIRELCTSLQMPAGDELKTLLRFVALQANRTPSAFEPLAKSLDEMASFTLHVARQSPDLWSSAVKELWGHGIEVLSSYEEAQEKPASELRWKRRDNDAVHNMLQALDIVYELLQKRIWTIMSIPAPLPEVFICSDDPISLVLPGNRSRSIWGLGWATPNTEVCFPLTKRVSLIGCLSPRYPNHISADPSQIAIMNTRTLNQASRFLYGPTSDFIWNDINSHIVRFAELRREIARRAESPKYSRPTS